MTAAVRTRDVPTLLLGALTFLAPFSIDVSLPGLPAIAAAIHAPGGTMQWTLSAYVLANGVGQLVWGPLSDRYGRRPIVLIGLGLFAAAAFACAFVNDVAALIALRLLQGFGSCAGSVCAFAIVQDLALPPQVGAARQAAISAVNNVGPLAAPIAGVWILSGLGWRQLYAIPALLGMIVLLAATALLPETATTSAGAALQRYRRVFALPRTAGLAPMIFALFAGYFAMISGSPFALVAQLHLSTTGFAGAFALEAASALLGSFVASGLAARFRPEQQLAAALALALAAGTANGVTGIWTPTVAAFVATMSFYAFAFGIAVPSTFTLALAEAGADSGVASGVLGSALSLGGATGSALGGLVPLVPSAAAGSIAAVAVCAAALTYGLSQHEP